MAGNHHGLVQTGIAVGKDVNARSLFTINIRIREVAAVLHAEAFHQFVGGIGTALTQAVQREAAPAPAPAAVGQGKGGMGVEELLVMGFVVAVTVGPAVGGTVTGLILRGRHDQRIIVAVGGIVIEEIVAVFQAAVPKGRILLAEPYVLFALQSGRGLGIAHVGFAVVEQRGGGEHPHLGAQGAGRCAGETAGPLADIGIGDIPDETGLLDGAHDERIDELHRFHGGSAAVGELLAHFIGLSHQAQSAEVAESVIVTAGHDGVGFSLEAALLVVAHIRHVLDVLDELPAFAHGLVDGHAAAGVRVQSAGEGLIGKFSLKVTVFGILGVLGEATGIVALDGTAPAAVAVVGVRQGRDGSTVHHVTGGVLAVQLSVGAPEEVTGILCAGKDRLHVHVHARGLLQESVAHGELVHAGGKAGGGADSQKQYMY